MAAALVQIVKTGYIYIVSTRLINVRLDPARLRKARTLREHGIVLSDVVREAIDQRYAALTPSQSPRRIRAVVDALFEQYPDPPDLAARDYDVHDRRAARAAISRRLRSARR